MPFQQLHRVWLELLFSFSRLGKWNARLERVREVTTADALRNLAVSVA